MRQATRIPGPPSDNQVLRKPAPNHALTGFDWRGWLRHRDGFNLSGWLKHFAGSLRAVNAHSGTATAERATFSPSVPSLPDHRATGEPEPDEAANRFGLIGWLKHFVVYLGAVAAVCLIGLYFLWQIPFLQDPSQLFKKIVDEGRAPSRPLAATAPPPAPASTGQEAASSSPPPDSVAAPGQPSVPTDAVATATSPPAPTPGDATGVQPEPQPAAAPDGQAGPDAPPTEATAEAVPAPPTTPQAQVEQLLTDAQQQMENRRFTAPASGNALSTYRRILELQPDHPAAIEGIQRITTYYRDIAQQSLQQGRLDESLAYINRGLRATPQNEALLSLRQQVQQAQKAARQREREEQRRQAALEEMQRQQLEQVRQEQLRRQQEQQQQPWWRQPSNYNDNSGFNQR